MCLPSVYLMSCMWPNLSDLPPPCLHWQATQLVKPGNNTRLAWWFSCKPYYVGFSFHCEVVFLILRLGTFIPEGAHMLCGGVLVLFIVWSCSRSKVSSVLFPCTHVQCLPKFIWNCFHLEKWCNWQIEQIQITNETPQSYWTLQMYRYPRTVQLVTLQMDYLLKRNINSARSYQRMCEQMGEEHSCHSVEIVAWRGDTDDRLLS